MHREQVRALNKGVFWKLNPESGDYEKEVPAENFDAQYESVIPLLVEKIEGPGSTAIDCTPDWLDSLPQDDYLKLEMAVLGVKNGPTAEDEMGKKKA